MEDAASLDTFMSLAPWMLWGFVAICGLFYFVSSYLFEILAQKLDAPRWMAWVPLASTYLMFKLVGWEKWFLMMIAGWILASISMVLGPLAFVGFIIMIPTVIAALVMGLMYWPKLAMERELSAGIGLLVVLPQFFMPVIQMIAPGLGLWASLVATLLSFGAFLMIVFHDGGPQSAPHPIGYVLTGIGCLLIAAAVHTIPQKLMEDPEFKASLQTLAVQMQEQSAAQAAANGDPEGAGGENAAASLMAQFAAWSAGEAELPEAVELTLPTDDAESLAFVEPKPHRLAESCPEGARERKGAHNGGRTRWCEIQHEGKWVRHGPMRTWYGNGSIADEGSYYRGRRSGTWTRYTRSGDREVQAEFHNGVQDGWMHRWDDEGNFVTGIFYKNGEPLGRPERDALAAQ